MKFVFAVILQLSCFAAFSQNSGYLQFIKEYQLKYVEEHEVVKGNDKKKIQFFAADEKFKVTARAEHIYESPWFKMETSGKEKKVYRVYAILYFTLNDTVAKLNVYQSQKLMGIKEYAESLFIPFTDLTSGDESYDNGRYLDLTIHDLESGSYTIDFNKAYNPYCAYISGIYNCPVPPKENNLSIAIRAGERRYAAEH
ncbi:MAG: DUF1684 domain-containing protein [Chitinophagaceae bacterium]|nr:DUF1684 domain-containing protein [Chitinophagaceae bacterium]MBK8951790.1 DUF1684 domain-containing protein [Chitinophagaceae bacterium]